MSSAIFSEKVFNDLKHEPYFSMEYATQVSKFVAQGACSDFRHAYENWRNPDLRAARPSFKKKNRVWRRIIPGGIRRYAHQIRWPPAHQAAISGLRETQA